MATNIRGPFSIRQQVPINKVFDGTAPTKAAVFANRTIKYGAETDSDGGLFDPAAWTTDFNFLDQAGNLIPASLLQMVVLRIDLFMDAPDTWSVSKTDADSNVTVVRSQLVADETDYFRDGEKTIHLMPGDTLKVVTGTPANATISVANMVMVPYEYLHPGKR